jgi:hypothetical protein
LASYTFTMPEPRCVIRRDDHDRAIVLVIDSEGREMPLKHVVRHSPTGMEFGYGGGGPSDLARSLMIHWFGDAVADLHYQDFKAQFVAALPTEGGVITKREATAWLQARELQREVDEGPEAAFA